MSPVCHAASIHGLSPGGPVACRGPAAIRASLAGRTAGGVSASPLAVIAPLTRAYRASRGVATVGAIATREASGCYPGMVPGGVATL